MAPELISLERMLTPTLGVPIGPAFKNMKAADKVWEGSTGLFLTGRDKKHFVVLTCSHVLPGPEGRTPYVWAGKSASKSLVQMPGDSAYASLVKQAATLVRMTQRKVDFLGPKAKAVGAQMKVKYDYEEAVETLAQARQFQESFSNGRRWPIASPAGSSPRPVFARQPT